MKATYAEINGKRIEIFKDPKTDDGTKRSHKGLIKVVKNEDGSLSYEDHLVRWCDFFQGDNELKLVFHDGKIYHP